MPKHRKLLIVLADGEHVRFVRPAADNTLRGDAAMDSPAAHKRSADLGTDHPGAAMHSGSSAHHALAPRHDLQALEKEKFAHAVADQLNTAAAGTFDDLVIAAPPHTLSAIRQKLNPATGAKLIGTLPKDLVHTPDNQLLPHLEDWVRPVHSTSAPS